MCQRVAHLYAIQPTRVPCQDSQSCRRHRRRVTLEIRSVNRISDGGVRRSSINRERHMRGELIAWHCQAAIMWLTNGLFLFYRLASSLISQKQAEQPVATPEIQSSIKEVTSAIVHYVNDQTNRGSRSRSVSPSTRWESVEGSHFEWLNVIEFHWDLLGTSKKNFKEKF